MTYPHDGRGEHEERMVTFGYYAQMAGARWDEGHTAEMAAMLKESDYDVQERLREISAWCYGPGRDLAMALDKAIRDGEEYDMDTDDVRASGETEQAFIEPWVDEVDAPRLSVAEVGHGEGAVEVTEQEVEAEEWTDGGTSDTASSWYKRLLSWTRRMTQSGS